MSGPADDPKVLSDPPPITPREAVQRWRLVLAREALRDDAAQREATGVWEAALVASGLPMAGLDLPRPRPGMRSPPRSPSAIPGEAELLDLYLVERLPAWRVREALSSAVPPTFRLVEAYDVWLGEPALPGRVTASVYRAAFDPAAVDPARPPGRRRGPPRRAEPAPDAPEGRRHDRVRPAAIPRGPGRGRRRRRRRAEDDPAARPREGARASRRGDRRPGRRARRPAGADGARPGAAPARGRGRVGPALGAPPGPRPSSTRGPRRVLDGRRSATASARRPRK